MSAPETTGKIFDGKVLRRILKQVAPYRRRFLWTGVIVVLLAGLSWVRPYLIRVALDDHIAVGDGPGLLRIFLTVVGLIVVEALLQFWQTYWANWVAQSVTLDLRAALFQHVSRFRLKYFDRTPVGQLVTRHISDIDGIADVFSNGLLNAVGDILRLVVVIGAMLWIDPVLTIIVLLPIPVLLVATRIFQKAIKKAFVSVRNEVARINVFVQEHVTGMNIIQAFGREAAEREKFAVHNGAHRAANIRSIWAFSIFFPVVEMLSATSVALLLWLGVEGVASRGLDPRCRPSVHLVRLHAVPPDSPACGPVQRAANGHRQRQPGVPPARHGRADGGAVRSFSRIAFRSEPLKGHIVFEDVWFAYTDEDWVLKGVSFEVQAGQRVAFVGATGAGKSSIINLLSRLYEFQKGRITIDGEDIRTIPLDRLRASIGVVLQDVFLFTGSLEDNITLYDPNIPRERVEEAVDAVGVRGLVDQLPGGLAYDVKERGVMLSTGQRQLIAFVRAYAQQPGHSDPRRGQRAATMAHRLCLDGRSRGAADPPDELIAAQGAYHRLFELQFDD